MDGKSWYPHNKGKWYNTGQKWNENTQTVRKIKIEPPMNGNFFRVIIDKNHKTGPEIQGRFDLLAVKNPDYKPEKLEPVAQGALTQLGATFTQSSAWSNGWRKPKLTSRTGFHSGRGKDNKLFWLQVDFPGDEKYEVSEMSLMRRADGCCGNQRRQINEVQFETSNDGKNWLSLNGGKWYKTGQKYNDPVTKERRFTIDPPIVGNMFRIIMTKDHKTGANYQGRFELWAVKADEKQSIAQVQSFETSEDEEELPTNLSEQE